MDQGINKRFDTPTPAHQPASPGVGWLSDFGLSTLRRWFRDESVRRVYSVAAKLFRGRLLAGIVSLAYLTVTAKTLGVAQFGVLVLINLVVVTIGDLAIFPGWYAVIRFGIPGFKNAGSPEFRKLLSFATCLELCSGIAGVLIALLVAPRVAPMVGIPTQAIPLMLVFSLAALTSARSTPAAILYLGERFNLLSIQQALAGLVRLTGAIVASLTDAGLTGFVYAWLLANLAEAGLMWLFALLELRRRGILKSMFVSPFGIGKIYPDIWHFSINTKLNKSLEDVSPRITPFAVGMVLEPMAVGLYQVAFRLGMLLSQPIIVLVGTVYPELTRLVRAGNLAAVHRVVLRSGLFAAASGLPIFLVSCFMETHCWNGSAVRVLAMPSWCWCWLRVPNSSACWVFRWDRLCRPPDGPRSCCASTWPQ